jgi:hypothetical protein
MISNFLVKFTSKMEVEMPNFAMLSMNDIEMTDVNGMCSMFEENTGYNGILDCETIDELLINICFYEHPEITFEQLQQKMIEYYFQEATGECISRHLEGLDDYFHHSIMRNLYERVMYMEHNDDSDHFNMNMIIEFITTPYGEEYLKNVFENRM